MTLAPANPDHLTQRELEQALWAAANAFRGPVDPGDFKSYVFPVVFYKWISDVYNYHHDQAIDDYGDDWTQEIEIDDYQTFLIPDGARCLAGTAVCPHQAFDYQGFALGLQFHLEADYRDIERWLIGHACELELVGIAPQTLRDQAARHGAQLEQRARQVFARWLDNNEPRM